MHGFLRKSSGDLWEKILFNPANIADHCRENNSRDFCVNPRNLRERKVFLHKSAHLRKKIFLIPLISQITAEEIYSGIFAQIRADLREKGVLSAKSRRRSLGEFFFKLADRLQLQNIFHSRTLK